MPCHLLTRHCHNGVQILADVSVKLHEAQSRSVVESASLFTNETWLVLYFSAMETFSADRDDVFRLGACKVLDYNGSKS